MILHRVLAVYVCAHRSLQGHMDCLEKGSELLEILSKDRHRFRACCYMLLMKHLQLVQLSLEFMFSCVRVGRHACGACAWSA